MGSRITLDEILFGAVPTFLVFALPWANLLEVFFGNHFGQRGAVTFVVSDFSWVCSVPRPRRSRLTLCS